MTLAEQARDTTQRQLARAVRRRRARRGSAVQSEVFPLHSTVGYPLYAHLHLPNTPGPHPGIVLCPGIGDPGTAFDGWEQPVTADELARQGWAVVHFDPAGRGTSWGTEDYGGHEHQDNAAVAVAALAEHPCVDATRIGLLSISLGVSTAVGAIVHFDAPAAWLLDWEGPSDREIITAGGTRMEPADGHGLHDEVYWTPREAVRHVGSLPCPYVRLQAQRDHAQPGELRHATRMLEAARNGQAPWVQINDEPKGTIPQRPNWLGDGLLEANRAILRKVDLLSSVRRTP